MLELAKTNDRGLNVLQELFVSEYLKDKNATQSYIRAGYKARGNSAEVNASKLLSNPKIRAEIDRRMGKILERVEITPERILQELGAIAFSRATDYVNIVEREGIEYDGEGKVRLDEHGKPKKYWYQAVDLKPTEELTLLQQKAIKTIKQNKEGIEIQFHDKKSALELLGRNAKMWTDKTELTGADGERLNILFNIPRPNQPKVIE